MAKMTLQEISCIYTAHVPTRDAALCSIQLIITSYPVSKYTHRLTN